MKQSIALEHGQVVPIIVNQNGIVLDGHNRFRACKELGIPVQYSIKEFDDPLEEKNNGLANVPELIDVQAKNSEIHEKLSPIVAKDSGMQALVEQFRSLSELVPKFKLDKDDKTDENGDEDVHKVHHDNMKVEKKE